MGIQALPQRSGPSRALVVCDDCTASIEVTCGYMKGSTNKTSIEPNESQARNHAIKNGWSFIKKKLRCPDCTKNRKVIPMKKEETDQDVPKRARIQIISLLADVYDLDTGRYKQGDTDDSVAQVLDVRAGWVKEVREAEFGPDGSNDDFEDFTERLDAMEEKVLKMLANFKDVQTAAVGAQNNCTKKLAEISAMKAEQERMKAALSGRVRKMAGV